VGVESNPLKIGLHQSAEGVVLSVAGGINTSSGAIFASEFARALALVGNGDLIVDMAGANPVSVTGILALLSASEDAVRHGVRLVVRHCRPSDPGMLDVLALSSTLDIEPTPSGRRSSPSAGRRSPWAPLD